MHATIDELTRQAWELRHADPLRAQALSQEALARLPSEGYAHGEADALRTLAWCKMHQGALSEALPVALRGLHLYTQLDHREGETYLRYLLGVIHWRMGNLDTALDYTLSSLQKAQGHADPRTRIAIHNSLGGIYFEQGNYEKAAKYTTEVLILATDETTAYFRAEALNNLAFLFCRMGRPEEGLPYLRQSLQILERLENNFGWLSTLHTAAVLYMDLKDYAMARHYLERGLHMAQTHHVQGSLAEFTVELGRLAQKEGNPDQALVCIQQALAIVDQVQSPLQQAQIHKALTEIYAEQGAFERALVHHQRFHQYDKQVFNERSSQRMQALQVMHEVELTQKEAEIYRLQAQELTAEIARREEIQHQLQKVARMDYLVDAYNRRYFFDLAAERLAQAASQRQPVGLLLIDIDHFKQINDLYGHLAADRVLTGLVDVINALLGANELLARYGGDEFVVLMVDASLARCQDLSYAIIDRLAAQPLLPHGRPTTVSIGAAFHPPSAEIDLLTKLIEQADQALYAVKRRGRNGYQRWEPVM